jgi:predicted dinucleotide-binding enzyme
MMGTREPGKLAEWQKAHSGAKLGSVSQAAAFAEVVVLAVKGSASAQALRSAGQNLAGKVVIDATNPISDSPPDHGVLSYFTKMNESLMEQLQREFAQARLVKAFNSVGNARFVNPSYAAGRPTMFICGNDEPAKKIVSGILDQFGWETADMGALRQHAPSNRCACCGAFWALRAMSGHTRSSCCVPDVGWKRLRDHRVFTPIQY